MSGKATRHAKYLARKEARTPLPARIDLIEWVRMRERMSRGKARLVVANGALKTDSHTLGSHEVVPSPGKSIKVFDQYASASVRGRIQVVTPEVLK